MTLFQRFCACLLLAAGGLAMGLPARAADSPPAVSAPVLRDGSHDFDFNIGVWRTHIIRRLHPLSADSSTLVMDGTVTVRKVWGGRAQLEEIETDSAQGHWEGMTLFLYNPSAHQWSQNFASSAGGSLANPTIGSFKDGRGELYAQDTEDGRSILVRGVWTVTSAQAHTYVESYSNDGGRTWEPVFSASLTRATTPAG